ESFIDLDDGICEAIMQKCGKDVWKLEENDVLYTTLQEKCPLSVQYKSSIEDYPERIFSNTYPTEVKPIIYNGPWRTIIYLLICANKYPGRNKECYFGKIPRDMCNEILRRISL